MTTYYGPDQWGPPSWRYLRTVLETTSDEQAQTSLLPMIKTFAAMLPCESCRKNFDDVLRRFPPEHYVKRDRASRLVWCVVSMYVCVAYVVANPLPAGTISCVPRCGVTSLPRHWRDGSHDTALRF